MMTFSVSRATDAGTGEEWEGRVKRPLKAELTREGITYAQLAGQLTDTDLMDSEPNIRNKISRGKFTACFYCNV
jgi:hypothetical protein